MFGRRNNWLFAAALLLFALIELIDAQYTAPGAYYVYAPGYNFNPPPPGPGGPGTVGKRSAEPAPSPAETANGTVTVTRRSVPTMESHTNGTEPTKRNAVTNGHGNVTEHQKRRLQQADGGRGGVGFADVAGGAAGNRSRFCSSRLGEGRPRPPPRPCARHCRPSSGRGDAPASGRAAANTRFLLFLLLGESGGGRRAVRPSLLRLVVFVAMKRRLPNERMLVKKEIAIEEMDDGGLMDEEEGPIEKMPKVGEETPEGEDEDGEGGEGTNGEEDEERGQAEENGAENGKDGGNELDSTFPAMISTLFGSYSLHPTTAKKKRPSHRRGNDEEELYPPATLSQGKFDLRDTRNFNSLLVEEVSRHPALFDFTRDEYKSTEARNRHWGEVAAEMNQTGGLELGQTNNLQLCRPRGWEGNACRLRGRKRSVSPKGTQKERVAQGDGKRMRVAQGDGKGMRVAQGDGKRMRVAQGDGKGMRVAQGDGKRMRVAQGDGKRMRVAQGDGKGMRVAQGDGKGMRVAQGDGKGMRVAQEDGKGMRVAQGDGKRMRVAQGDGKGMRVAQGDGKRMRVAQGDGKGMRVAQGDGKRMRVAQGDGKGMRVAQGDGKRMRVAQGDGKGMRVAQGDGKGMRVAQGDGKGMRVAQGDAKGACRPRGREGNACRPRGWEGNACRPRGRKRSVSPKGTGRECVSPKGMGRECVSPKGTGRECVSPKGMGRECVSPKGMGRECVSPKGMGRECVSPKGTGRECVSPKGMGRECVSPKGTGRECVSPKGMGRECVSPKGMGRECVSPKGMGRECVSPKGTGRECVSPKGMGRECVSPKGMGRECVSPKGTLPKLEFVRTRWKTLRDRFKKEVRRQHQCVEGPIWQHYEKMLYLLPFIRDKDDTVDVGTMATAGGASGFRPKNGGRRGDGTADSGANDRATALWYGGREQHQRPSNGTSQQPPPINSCTAAILDLAMSAVTKLSPPPTDEVPNTDGRQFASREGLQGQEAASSSSSDTVASGNSSSSASSSSAGGGGGTAIVTTSLLRPFPCASINPQRIHAAKGPKRTAGEGEGGGKADTKWQQDDRDEDELFCKIVYRKLGRIGDERLKEYAKARIIDLLVEVQYGGGVDGPGTYQ
uniref:MADF domain-containing protein n=1 Tax=Globodera rostochiensis TaxID=31243 RepID=A0A914HEB1_GLORO